jgi:hypothetical protein
MYTSRSLNELCEALLEHIKTSGLSQKESFVDPTVRLLNQLILERKNNQDDDVMKHFVNTTILERLSLEQKDDPKVVFTNSVVLARIRGY